MRIAMLSDGASTHTLRWASFFHDAGDEVRLFTLEDPLEMPLPVSRLRRRSSIKALAYPMALGELKARLAEFKPDLVNAHFVPNYGWLGLLAGLRPLVVSTWGSDVLINARRTPFHAWRARRVLRGADLITSDARMLTDAIIDLSGDQVEILTAPMGISAELLSRPLADPAPPPILLHNRNLETVYDVDTLLDALPAFLDANPHWRVRLAGDGSLRASLEEQAAALGLGSKVTFLGRLPREQLLSEVAAARIYVSASLSDSSSVSLLEALALGAYPVISDIPANREWVESPGRGRFFPCGDSQALAAALGQAASLDEGEVKAALSANRELIARDAVWEENMGQVRRAFLGLIGAGQ